MSANYGQHCELSNLGLAGVAQLIAVKPEINRGENYATSENVDFFIIHFFTNRVLIRGVRVANVRVGRVIVVTRNNRGSDRNFGYSN